MVKCGYCRLPLPAGMGKERVLHLNRKKKLRVLKTGSRISEIEFAGFLRKSGETGNTNIFVSCDKNSIILQRKC